jgi:IS5 family transposase
MHDLPAIYEKTLSQVRCVIGHMAGADGNFHRCVRRPKMNDLEVIALALTAESMGIDSESLLFSKLRSDYRDRFPLLVDRTRFNRRRRALSGQILSFASEAGARAAADTGVHLVDSMPCPVIRNSRERGYRVCREEIGTAPAKGWSAVDRRYFIGYKLHLVTCSSGVFRDMCITPANVHDINYIKGFTEGHVTSGKVLVADRGYISAKVQTSLFDQLDITLKVPYRRDQKDYRPPDPVMALKRRRIETLFSQLTDQFKLKLNYAKTFLGFKTRVVSKLAAVSLLQLINAQNDRPLNRIKHAWAQ